jgi:hypothetical protein
MKGMNERNVVKGDSSLDSVPTTEQALVRGHRNSNHEFNSRLSTLGRRLQRLEKFGKLQSVQFCWQLPNFSRVK